MPTEITIESASKITMATRGLAKNDKAVSSDGETAMMRQELPSNAPEKSEQIDNAKSGETGETIHKEVEELNTQVQNVRRDLHFTVDADSGRTIIRVIDSETQETIRTIPPEEMSVLSQLLEKRSGALLSTSV